MTTATLTKRGFACPHLRTTILDDKKYCVDCGEELDDWEEEYERDKV